jgi:hypothetical protein
VTFHYGPSACVDVSSADSLQFDEPIRLYPCKLCYIKCKRVYDLHRHYQTKHSRSLYWFCPLDTCKLSRAALGLSEALDASDLRDGKYQCRNYRRPLTHEVVYTDNENGYTKLRLHGFSRRDKLTKHLKKAHPVSGSCRQVIFLITDTLSGVVRALSEDAYLMG